MSSGRPRQNTTTTRIENPEPRDTNAARSQERRQAGAARLALEAWISQVARVAERYVATHHNRTADAEIPPVGLPH